MEELLLIGELRDKKMLDEIKMELVRSQIEFTEKYFEESEHFALFTLEETRLEEAREIFRVKLGFKKSFEVDQDWVKIKSIPRGPITFNIVIFCVVIFVFSYLNFGAKLYDLFFIGKAESDFFHEVKTGQVWRLVTPIFLHMNIFHILFNMMWFKDLGYLIEHQYKKEFLIVFILGTGLFSNLLQYCVSGPNFGGMSGVLYAMCGFIWTRYKCDPSSEYKIPGRDLAILIGWMFLCLTGLVGPVANTAHAAGLFSGMVAALLFFKADKTMKIKMALLACFFLSSVLAVEWLKFSYNKSQFFIFMWI